MNPCPCCSHNLLRHIQAKRLYWFCSRCRQEMPYFTSGLNSSSFKKIFSNSA
ncbi:hypothetical protein Chro_5940 (plasmid) [Chroococcidiopsis thermalis PCC 7203]|uniref:Uncharacterized protein n=1 Tax=Chroococcidiopsis thermalis (strain PCC 7203) TaxID=251229 RepID=K9UAQ2_CHRTP|nr:hypothetical protein Chro_5940 [Chroococcidiopsis thermalis PCC 7203]